MDSAQKNADQISEMQGNESDNDVVFVTKWTCDICRVAAFDSYDEAVAHELQCDKKSSPAPLAVSTNNNPKKSCGVTASHKNNLTEPSSSASDSDSVVCLTIWTCDKCQVAEFTSYAEAIAHEKICKFPSNDGVDEKRSKGESTENSKQYDSSSQNDKKKPQPLINFSPLIDCVDDCAQYYSISTYDLMISKSIDLFEDSSVFPTNDPSICPIAYRCHFCKATLGGDWVLEKLVDDWQGTFYSHFLVCKEMPTRIKEMLMTVKPYASTGKVEVRTFLKAFLDENGILESTSGKCKNASNEKINYTYFMHHTKWMNQLKKSDRLRTRTTRRERWMVENNMKLYMNGKNQHTTNLFDPDQSRHDQKNFTNVHNRPFNYQDIPILFPDSQKYSQLISPFNHLALQQLKLCCSADYKVSLACIHCKTQSLLVDADSWFKRVYSMIYAHLLKSCREIPHSTRLQLQRFQSNKPSASLKSIGLKQYCEFVAEYYKFKNIASHIGVYMRVKANTNNGTKTTKRKSPEITRNVSAESSEANQNKKQRNSPQKVSKSDDIKWNHFILKHGSQGDHTYLPPQDGVPLISSVSKASAAKLNKQVYLLLDQLEIFEIKKFNQKSNIVKSANSEFPSSALGIRCQNCRSQPKFTFSLKLSATEDLSRIVSNFDSHLQSCPFTPGVIRKELMKNKISTKSTSLLDTYCKHIAHSYSLKDYSTKDCQSTEKMVIWGENKPYDYRSNAQNQTLEKEQSHVIDQIKETNKKSLVNNVNLDQANSSSLKISRTWSERMVLSDYNYIILGQIDLAAVPKKIATLQTSTRTSLRQKNKVGDPDNEISSKPCSRSASPVSTWDSFTIGLRCKHCLHARALSSIQQCVTNHTYNFFNHFKKCPKTPRKIAVKLDEVKAYQSLQKSSDGVAAMTEYIRKIILDVYKMEDLEWNGVSGGVILGSDAENVIRKYSRNKTDSNQLDHNFALPYILDDFAEPVTSYLTDFVN